VYSSRRSGLTNPRFDLTRLGPESYALTKTRPGLVLQVKRKHVRHNHYDRRGFAMRVVTALLVASFFLVGCTAPIQSLVTGTDAASRKAVDLFGERVTDVESRAIEGESADHPKVATMGIHLSSGEPTGTQPFEECVALAQTYPAMDEYQISHYIKWQPRTDKLITYIWKPEAGTLQWLEGDYSGSVGTSWPRGFLSGMDPASVEAIAAGESPAPSFVPSVELDP